MNNNSSIPGDEITLSVYRVSIFFVLAALIAILGISDVMKSAPGVRILADFTLCAGAIANGVLYWMRRDRVRVSWNNETVVGPPARRFEEPVAIQWRDIDTIGYTNERPLFLKDSAGRIIRWHECGKQDTFVRVLRLKRPDLFTKSVS